MEKFSRATPNERKQYLTKRLIDLKRLREPWLDRWREVSDYIAPFVGRFGISDHLESRDYRFIIDNVAEHSLNILVSGLASGVTSPVRQWFKLSLPDINANQDISAARWCSDVEAQLMRAFQQSNTYNSLHSLYRELCLFGIGVDLVMEDAENVLRHHVLSAGEYCLQVNSNGVVDTLYREFQLTVGQAVEQFGFDNVPTVIKDAFRAGDLDHYYNFCHAIEPRRDRDIDSPSSKNMPFASYYFMVHDGSDNDGIISESGFNYFPALCPRWDVLAGETYGVSPAMTALPNVKQLQQESDAKATALELMTNPPIQAPSTLRQEPLSLTPGNITYTGMTGADQTIKPIITSAGDISAISADIDRLIERIQSDFFVDLFLLVQQATNDRKTAAEIYALKEEKMLVLGSVMERLQHELLRPLVVMTYNKLKQNQLLPQPPQRLKGANIEPEFQSMLVQSQRSVDINAIDRMMAAMQSMGAVLPGLYDRVDEDRLFDVYRERLGVDPKIARSIEDANAIRQQRAQAQAQAQEMQSVEQGANAYNQFMQAQKASADASMATQNLDVIGGAV